MEHDIVILHLKEMTVAEILDVIAEAHAGNKVDVYEHLQPELIDKATDTLWEFISAVKEIKK